MRTRAIEGTGFKLSVIGLGTRPLAAGRDPVPPRQAEAVIRGSLEAGVDWIETSPAYGAGRAEAALGRFLGRRREEVSIVLSLPAAAAGGAAGIRPGWVAAAVEESLRRLRTDRVEACLVDGALPEAALAATTEGLHALVRAGKARVIGAVRPAAPLRAALLAAGGGAWIEAPYSLARREAEREFLPWTASAKAPFLACEPLARGALVDASDAEKGAPRPVAARLAAAARDCGISAAALALAWAVGEGGALAAAAGARRPERIDDWTRAGDLALSTSDREALAARVEGREAPTADVPDLFRRLAQD